MHRLGRHEAVGSPSTAGVLIEHNNCTSDGASSKMAQENSPFCLSPPFKSSQTMASDEEFVEFTAAAGGAPIAARTKMRRGTTLTEKDAIALPLLSPTDSTLP